MDSGSERSGDNNLYYAADAMENEPDHGRSPGYLCSSFPFSVEGVMQN